MIIDSQKFTTMTKLGGSKRAINITGISYKMPGMKNRCTILFKGKGHWLNLHPNLESSSCAYGGSFCRKGIGVHLRDNVRMNMDFVSGEITYCPRSKELLFHCPLTTKTMQSVDYTTNQSSSKNAKVPRPIRTTDAFCESYLRIQKQLTEPNHAQSITNKHERKRVVRKLKRSIRHIFKRKKCLLQTGSTHVRQYEL